jgi:hypothetical protein
MIRSDFSDVTSFQISALPLLGITAAVLFGVPLAAAQLPEFSADVITTTGATVSNGKIYHTAWKDRLDTSMHLPAMMGRLARTSETHMITDREQKLIYLVDPQKKSILVNYAMQIVSGGGPDSNPDKSCTELAKASGSMVAMKAAGNCKQIGFEEVNGRNAAKWEVQVGMGAVQLGTWTVWVDAQLKMTVKWRTSDGNTGELRNIQQAPQPASLFDLPADYHRQDLPH